MQAEHFKFDRKFLLNILKLSVKTLVEEFSNRTANTKISSLKN